MKKIYRGFFVELKNGKWVVIASDGEQISSRLATEEEAYHFIDAHKRRGGK